MNENEVEDVRDVIEDVRDVIEDAMSKYIFELADEKTMKAITKDIATKIHIEDYFDYLLEATVDQDNIVIDLCIKPTESDNFTHFTGSYSDCPAIKNSEEHKETKKAVSAYERAMKGI